MTAILRSDEALRLHTAARLRGAGGWRHWTEVTVRPKREPPAGGFTAGLVWFVSGVVLPRGNVRRDFIDRCEFLPLHRQAPMQGAPLAPSPWRGFCLAVRCATNRPPPG